MDYQIVQARLFEQKSFFIYGIEQFYVGISIKNHSRMRKESKHQALATGIMSTMNQSFQNFFVTDVHTVKSTKGDDGFRFGFEILYGMENFQKFNFFGRKYTMLLKKKRE